MGRGDFEEVIVVVIIVFFLGYFEMFIIEVIFRENFLEIDFYEWFLLI